MREVADKLDAPLPGAPSHLCSLSSRRSHPLWPMHQHCAAAVLQVLRALAWGLLAGAAAYLRGVLSEWEQKFYKGQYPPPRNTAKD